MPVCTLHSDASVSANKVHICVKCYLVKYIVCMISVGMHFSSNFVCKNNCVFIKECNA